MKKNMDINILGYKYSIRSDMDDGQAQEIIEYLNVKIEEVLQTTNTVDTLNIVVLAALNIAGDLFRAKSDKMELEDHIEERSKRLVSFIDCQMAGKDRFLS